MDLKPHLFSTRAWVVAARISGAAFVLFLSAPVAAQSPDACLPRDGQTIRIVAVTERGELRLADERLVRLPGLDLGADLLPAPVWSRHLASLRDDLQGREFLVDAGQGFADRWGRIAIHARGTGHAESLHALLVKDGRARVLPSDANEACQRFLLGLEAAARRSKLGLWREPAMRVIPARETDALKALQGRYALAEGKVLSVNARAQRTYVNFGRYFTRDFSVTIGRRHRGNLEKAGISLSSLRDRTVRVRGIVGGRTAPQIDIVSPAQIEVVEE